MLIVVCVAICAVPDLPAAQADRLAADRHLPGGRAVGPGQLPAPARMRRGFAITLVYLGLLPVPVALVALIVPAARQRRRTTSPATRRSTRAT